MGIEPAFLSSNWLRCHRPSWSRILLTAVDCTILKLWSTQASADLPLDRPLAADLTPTGAGGRCWARNGGDRVPADGWPAGGRGIHPRRDCRRQTRRRVHCRRRVLCCQQQVRVPGQCPTPSSWVQGAGPGRRRPVGAGLQSVRPASAACPACPPSCRTRCWLVLCNPPTFPPAHMPLTLPAMVTLLCRWFTQWCQYSGFTYDPSNPKRKPRVVPQDQPGQRPGPIDNSDLLAPPPVRSKLSCCALPLQARGVQAACRADARPGLQPAVWARWPRRAGQVTSAGQGLMLQLDAKIGCLAGAGACHGAGCHDPRPGWRRVAACRRSRT